MANALQHEDRHGVEMASLASFVSQGASGNQSHGPSIPGYEIIEQLGRGGMGVVYKARQSELNRIVALKVIRNSGHDEQGGQRRFRRETQAASRLSHPNIISVYDAGMVDDTYFLVMQFIDGIDLEHLVLDSGPLAVDQACDYVRQVALGLQHAYQQGMVHRDIKPANLMVTEADEAAGGEEECGPRRKGFIKILDMGLARLHWGEGDSSISRLTGEGTIMGTPDYMAPEQVDNSHTVDIRADLYSLGCTFYFLLTGWVPFPCCSSVEKFDKHRWARPKLIERIRREVPRTVGGIVRKLMAKRPEERYQTPAELVAVLDAAQQKLYLDDAADNSNEGTRVCKARTLDQELESLQLALADRLEHNDLHEARGVLEAMFRLKPNDSLALSVRAFVDEQMAILEPVGECRRFQGHLDWIWSVAFSPDGKGILSAGGDKTIHLWDAQTGGTLSSMAGHEEAVKCVSFSADGQRALSCGKDRSIRLWDISRGREIRTYMGHANAVECVTFSPTGRQLASCGGKSIRLWDVDSGQCLHRFATHSGEVKCVVFCLDGTHLLSGSWDHSVRLWDLEARCERRRLDGAMNLFTSVAVSPDGKKALGGGSDTSVYLWDIETGHELRRMTGHTSWVTSVAFSPDGRRALSGSQDQTVRLWDVDTGSEAHCFEGHTNWVTCVAFSPDGRYALSGSADCTLRLWRLPR